MVGQGTTSVPVLIGVGQHSERIGAEDYEALSPVDLAARAARVALADAGVDAGEVDVVACTRQFDESFPGMPALLGRSDSFPASVAARLGIDAQRLVYEIAGGQSPQRLVTELAGEVAAGRARVALVAGSEATSTVLHLLGQADRPDFTEETGVEAEDRGAGLEGMVTRYLVAQRLIDAPTQYALFENARRTRLGLSRADHAREMGGLFAPFTEVAARNPHAAAPTARTPEELVTVTDSNRMIVDPYPKSLVSRDKVNLGGAVLVTSEEVAEQLGVPREQWVYLRGHSDLNDRPILERPDLSTTAPSVRAVEAALDMAGIGLDDLTGIDLYSCFPIAVSAVAEGLGLAHDDPRGLTLTGGLPFFGGPGNSYSLHAIAEAVGHCRAQPGGWSLVGANGGMLSKYSAGVYSTAPGPWLAGDDARLQAELDAVPGVPVVERADGWATIETWTVQFQGAGRSAVVVGRLEDGRRFLANEVDGDTELVDLLLGEDAAGARIFVRSRPQGNVAALSEERMAELLPPRPVGFRDSYGSVQVRRDGHLLEVTIDRPESRNALTPDANQELADVFDAFEADRDLWVAIVTGAGDQAFCAGNDLKHTAGGFSIWVPDSGFGGLTSRRLRKPVIAALNGHALGGGLEIALACHAVIAEEHAELALTEVKVGLVAAMGGLVRLPRVLPPVVANEMILTGRRMPASEAERWGLVNRVVPKGSALAAARELAGQIMESSPTSVRVSLQAMSEAAGHADPVDAVTAPSDALDQLIIARDTSEGVTAFAMKRTPRWRNL